MTLQITNYELRKAHIYYCFKEYCGLLNSNSKEIESQAVRELVVVHTPDQLIEKVEKIEYQIDRICQFLGNKTQKNIKDLSLIIKKGKNGFTLIYND